MIPVVIFLLLLAAALSIFILRQPNEFRVTRKATLTASRETLFNQVNTLKEWDNWSPWAKLDPLAKNTLSGPSAGVGSTLEWAGNNKVGSGRMEILDSAVPDFIKMRLEFFRPMKALNTTEFSFTDQESGTLVTWTMFGPNRLPGKIMALFMNCDKMVGKQFEQGLRQLDIAALSKN